MKLLLDLVRKKELVALVGVPLAVWCLVVADVLFTPCAFGVGSSFLLLSSCSLWFPSLLFAPPAAFLLLPTRGVSGSSSSSDSGRRCFYDILGVNKGSTVEVIKKSYRRLSMKFHPDRNKAPEAPEKFKEIASAYEVLSDQTKRGIYDRHGFDGLDRADGGMDANQHDPFEIFSQFFNPGGGARGARREGRKSKSPSLHLKLRVTLEQLYFGELLQVDVTRPVVCVHAEECFRKQSECQGPGLRVMTQQMGPGFIVQNQIADSTCVEKGKAWDKNCSFCPKGQTIPETTTLTQFVEKGTAAKERITFEGSGEQRIGHENGDVIFEIVQLHHDRFVREGDDLHFNMQINLVDALVGFRQPFLHINGKSITVDKDDVTHDGEIYLLKNKGMPRKGGTSDDDYGDLYIKFQVVYPKQLEEQQKQVIREALKGTTPKLT